MKLAAALNPLWNLCSAIGVIMWPIIMETYKSPSILFRPATLSQIAVAHIWILFGDMRDEAGRPTKQDLITPNAHGVVLDIGAGVSI